MSRAQLTSMTADNVVQETLVGSTGNSIKGGSVAPFVAGKNKIINGDFGIWQRGTSFAAIGNSVYNADRWFFYTDAATATVSQQAFTPGNPIAGYEPTYFHRTAVTSIGSGTYIQADQKIENVQTFAGQTVTVSFWAKADSARSMLIVLWQNFGSGGSSTVTNTASGTFGTTWQRYSFTITLPSISGKTIGAGSSLELAIRQTATAGATMDLWGVQVEAGPVATPFTTASNTLQGELALCQRYFQRFNADSQYCPYAMAEISSTTTAYAILPHIVEMRTTPSSSYASAGNFALSSTGTNFTPTGLAGSTVSKKATQITITSSSMTAGRIGRFTDYTGSSYIDLSAEL